MLSYALLVSTYVLQIVTLTQQGFSEVPKFSDQHRSISTRLALTDWIERKWEIGIKTGNLLHGDPAVFYNMSELVTSQGYPCEVYDVVTDDEYILRLYRIPYGRNGTRTRDQPVVLLQHGLLASSTNWVTNLPTESLGFLLADAGFDVWLGNSRGNCYSLGHKKYTPRDEEYWAFSWDQMALHDLPAVIGQIEKTTGKNHIYYAGHSQGTMQAFALFSRNQEIASKIKMFFALAPVVTVGHIEGPIKYFSLVPDEVLLDIFGRRDFLPSDEIIHILADSLCKEELTRFLCYDTIFLLCGFDISNLNKSRLPVYISHTPAGTSTRNMIHYSQMKRTNAFQMYNYDSKKENIKHYGQTCKKVHSVERDQKVCFPSRPVKRSIVLKEATPPLYDVTKMDVPIALFSGGHDWLADPTDVSNLLPKLKNVKSHITIPKYEHLDFIWGIDAHKLVYQPIIKMIKDDIKSTK